jgi:hypothetical protein
VGKSKGPRVKRKSEDPRQEKDDPIRPENRFFRYWKLFWAIGGPLIAAISTAMNFQPELSITTGANIDPTQTFAMQFAVSNTGRVPVRNLRFSCSLRGGGPVFIGSMRPGNIAPVQYLPKGQTVTRGCFNESKDIIGATLLVNVNYDWPWLPIIGGAKAVSFVPVKTTTGFVMVPDYQN